MSDNIPSYGIILSNRGPVLDYCTPSDLIDLGVCSEESGVFDTVWAGDAFLTNPRLDAIVLLSAVASRTSRVRLGPACMGSFTQRGALDLAYQWASLDQVAKGRSVMVACAGGGSGEAWINEGRNTGVDPADRRKLMWERIKLLRELWRDNEVGCADFFHDFEGVSIEPKPIRNDYPIWAATNITRLATGSSTGSLPAKTLKRVGEICDGWMTHSVTPQTFFKAWEKILKAARESNKQEENMDNALVVNICINDDPSIALEEAGSFLADYYNIQFSTDRTRDWTAHGPPRDCARALAEYKGSGVKHIALRIASRDQKGQFDRFLNDVVPLLN